MIQRSVIGLNRSTSCRSFHASTAFLSNASHNRLAGRNRFYKQVGTVPVSSPWETSRDENTIDSPISAGVDGTQSASGVSRNIASQDLQHKMLQTRNPKTNDPISCEWFGVTLDGKSIKTPMGKNLAVPSPFLAWAIAAEWDAQQQTLQPAQMPLMTLTCTAMDQVTASVDAYREQALRYLPTDTTCYWADPGEDRVLHRKQQKAWDGLHDYCETFLQSRPSLAMGASEGVIMSRSRALKQSGLPHPPELLKKAQEWVDTLDAWHLCALHSVTSESKSFLVGMAVILSNVDPSNPFHDLTRAVAASRVEEEFQIDCWGLVEGGHDYDRLNCSVQIHAARFLTASITTGGTLKSK